MKTARFGLGFRTPHARDILATPRRVDWLEVVSDHYLGAGGPRRTLLDQLRRDYPIALHGVGLGVAGSDPLDEAYLASLAELVARCDPAYVSDHLCWTGFGGNQSHDLLPLAYTDEVMRHVAERVQRVQERIGRALLLENATAYVNFRASEMDEAEFFAGLCTATGCGLLLDVNNLYVNAMNLGADPQRALAVLPAHAVGYLHLAGHAVLPDVRIDTHAESVPAEVWALFAAAVRRCPHADVILERDDDLPAYDALVAEVDIARARHAAALVAPAEPAAPSGVCARDKQGPHADWRSLQRAFWQRIVAPRDPSDSDACDDLLDETLPVRASRGIRVYGDGYRASLRDALATNFPSLVCALAPGDWIGLCDAYFAAHPPRGHGFTGIGAALADFLHDHAFAEEYAVDRVVFAEMARLEQAQLEAQDAPDPERTVSPAGLAAVDPDAWEHAIVSFAPCVRVVRASHDVAPTVRAASRGDALERPPSSEMTYLVARGGDAVETIALAAGDGALAEALFAGRAFGAACAASHEMTGEDESTAVEQGARWLLSAAARGWLLAVQDPRGGHDASTNRHAVDLAGDDRARARELHDQSSSRA